jgi:hypothetical protein
VVGGIVGTFALRRIVERAISPFSIPCQPCVVSNLRCQHGSVQNVSRKGDSCQSAVAGHA